MQGVWQRLPKRKLFWLVVVSIVKPMVVLSDRDLMSMSNRLSVDPIDLKKSALIKEVHNITAFVNSLYKVSFCTENDVQKHLNAASEINKIIEKLKEHLTGCCKTIFRASIRNYITLLSTIEKRCFVL